MSPTNPPVVPVTITVNPNGTLSVNPDPFIVHKLDDQVVRWTCTPDQAFSVEFENDCPFYESQFSRDAPCSGIVRRNILPGSKNYKYTVRVGQEVLDPGGEVDK